MILWVMSLGAGLFVTSDEQQRHQGSSHLRYGNVIVRMRTQAQPVMERMLTAICLPLRRGPPNRPSIPPGARSRVQTPDNACH